MILVHVQAMMAEDNMEELIALAGRVADSCERYKDELVGSGSAEEIARGLLNLKTQYEALDKAVKRIYHVKDFLDKVAVPAALEKMGVDMIRIPEVGRSFSVQTKLSASFLDKDKGFEWLRGINQGDIIQETVNAGTLASFCRNLILEEGIDPPEDIVKLSWYKTTGIAKYTPKPGASK